jgi:ABC-type Fe3+ transport system substrate-binding protein
MTRATRSRIAALVAVGGVALAIGCRIVDGATDIYTSVPESVADPVVDRFVDERREAVRVTHRADTLAAPDRTRVGEPPRQADAWWLADPLHLAALVERGVLPPRALDDFVASADAPRRPGAWVPVGGRAVVLHAGAAADSVLRANPSVGTLLRPRWRWRVAMADPRRGAMGFHVGVLAVRWGDERVKALFDSLAANGVTVVATGAEVQRLVASGRAVAGWGDHGLRLTSDGSASRIVVPDPVDVGLVLVPALAASDSLGDRREAGRRFVAFLRTRAERLELSPGDSAALEVEAAMGSVRYADAPLRDVAAAHARLLPWLETWVRRVVTASQATDANASLPP